MLLDLLILLGVRDDKEVWYKKIIDYINEHQEEALEELKELCDINNYTSPYKATTIVHNANVIYNDVINQLENAQEVKYGSISNCINTYNTKISI